ncbi:MAG: glycosyltransferase family 4 protein, partial [Flavobacteriales bacterium]|nr:glycosyltransferase family 4 protein [Flavobacteriales bacterium]
EAHTEAKPIKVLFLGRIQDLKGIEELVDAIGQLKIKEKLNDFKFSIVGHENKTGYTDSLKQKLKSYNVTSEKAAFLGRITGQEKYQLYATHDIYVLPSYTEGCPNSFLEALASGLFCITTRVGALSDLISPKANGLFVKTKDSEDLLSALLYCSSHKDFNKNRLANAEKYSAEFDIKKITRLFENKYIDLIENK